MIGLASAFGSSSLNSPRSSYSSSSPTMLPNALLAFCASAPTGKGFSINFSSASIASAVSGIAQVPSIRLLAQLSNCSSSVFNFFFSFGSDILTLPLRYFSARPIAALYCFALSVSRLPNALASSLSTAFSSK